MNTLPVMGNVGSHLNQVGNWQHNLNVSQIDQDYQMIDVHVDEGLKRKIQAFEYIDFSKLISKNKVTSDDDQRLEIVKSQWNDVLITHI